MKKLILLTAITLIVVQKCMCQQNEMNKADSVFMFLDSSLITTGVLIDKPPTLLIIPYARACFPLVRCCPAASCRLLEITLK